jgi:hypothetical protein
MRSGLLVRPGAAKPADGDDAQSADERLFVLDVIDNDDDADHDHADHDHADHDHGCDDGGGSDDDSAVRPDDRDNGGRSNCRNDDDRHRIRRRHDDRARPDAGAARCDAAAQGGRQGQSSNEDHAANGAVSDGGRDPPDLHALMPGLDERRCRPTETP